MVPLARVAGTAPCAPAPGSLRHYNRPRRGLHEVHETFSRGSGAEMRPPQLPLLGMAIVRGRSMTPTLYDGDRLLVRHGATPRAGRLAVVQFSDGVVAVKRLDHQTRDGWWVTRDNADGGPGLLVRRGDRRGRRTRSRARASLAAPGHSRRASGRCAKVSPWVTPARALRIRGPPHPGVASNAIAASPIASARADLVVGPRLPKGCLSWLHQSKCQIWRTLAPTIPSSRCTSAARWRSPPASH